MDTPEGSTSRKWRLTPPGSRFNSATDFVAKIISEDTAVTFDYKVSERAVSVSVEL